MSPARKGRDRTAKFVDAGRIVAALTDLVKNAFFEESIALLQLLIYGLIESKFCPVEQLAQAKPQNGVAIRVAVVCGAQQSARCFSTRLNARFCAGGPL